MDRAIKEFISSRKVDQARTVDPFDELSDLEIALIESDEDVSLIKTLTKIFGVSEIINMGNLIGRLNNERTEDLSS